MPTQDLRCFIVAILGSLLLVGVPLDVVLHAAPIPVRYSQGSQHGFLALRTQEGTRIATGDVTQDVHGDIVTSQLTFNFRDGSMDEETTVFSQRGVFRLISDHHIQRGPPFPKQIDVVIDAVHGLTTSRDEGGQVHRDHLDLPADLANGLPPNLLLNILLSAAETDISYLLPAKKPRLIRVSIKSAGMVPFSIGGTRRKAIDYVLHVELGGLTGIVAPIVGKEPPDFHIWILGGAHPAFIREEGQLYEGGPMWRIEQTVLPWLHREGCALQRLRGDGIRIRRAAVEHGWSRNVLVLQIKSRLHEREGKAQTNFQRALPPPDTNLAEQGSKGPLQLRFPNRHLGRQGA